MKPNQIPPKKISIFKDFDFAQIERTKILLQAHKLQQQTKDEILQDITNFPKKCLKRFCFFFLFMQSDFFFKNQNQKLV